MQIRFFLGFHSDRLAFGKKMASTATRTNTDSRAFPELGPAPPSNFFLALRLTVHLLGFYSKDGNEQLFAVLYHEV